MQILGFAAVAFLLVLVAGGFYLFAAARLAGIENATFSKCFLINIAIALIFPAVRFLIGLALHPGLLQFVAVFIIEIWILAKFLDSSWGKAFLVGVIHFVLTILTLLLFATFFGVGLAALLSGAV